LKPVNVVGQGIGVRVAPCAGAWIETKGDWLA